EGLQLLAPAHLEVLDANALGLILEEQQATTGVSDGTRTTDAIDRALIRLHLRRMMHNRDDAARFGGHFPAKLDQRPDIAVGILVAFDQVEEGIAEEERDTEPLHFLANVRLPRRIGQLRIVRGEN